MRGPIVVLGRHLQIVKGWGRPVCVLLQNREGLGPLQIVKGCGGVTLVTRIRLGPMLVLSGQIVKGLGGGRILVSLEGAQNSEGWGLPVLLVAAPNVRVAGCNHW